MSLRHYVYYRVRADAVDAVLARVRALQQRWIEEAPSLQCERLRRSDERGETVTLMEVLRGATPEQLDAFEAEAARELAPWVEGERHVERFAPCA